jgi:outer membrane protein OmpA-like peptidoglycan-associated protein
VHTLKAFLGTTVLTSRAKRALSFSVVLALVGTFLPFSVPPSNATLAPCYSVENGVLTNGSACSGDVVIEEGITAIGQYNGGWGAFQESGITSVTIPASVETIMYGAFWDKTGLTSVTFAPGSTLTSIGKFAFAGTQNLKSITLPSSVHSIGSNAFSGSGIRYIVLEGAPPSVDPYNFAYLEGLSSNVIAWVTSANLSAFNSQTPKLLPDIRSLTGDTPPPSIYSPSDGATLSATVGVYFYQEVSFFGVGNPILEVSSGSLPPGININASTGIISGTPTTTPPLVPRTYPVSLRVRDGAQSESVSISFEVDPPPLPTINDENFSGYVGIPMNKELSFFALGEETVSLSEGSLPPGMSINSSNRIVGIPTSNGTYRAKLTVTDSYSQSVTSDDFVFEIEPSLTVSISASLTFMNPTGSSETHLDSVITTNAPNDFIICGFFKDAKDSGGAYQRDNCQEKQWSEFISDGISSNVNYSYSDFENTTWVIRVYGPDARAVEDPDINTAFLATVTVKVSQENLYRNWQTPLSEIANGPTVGEMVYASAFERALTRNLFKDELGYRTNATDYPTPEEYVYRITKEENAAATSIDHQLHDAYESLTSSEQSDWYAELGFGGDNPEYQFTWMAFMCVNQDDDYSLTKPTSLNLSYASREDGLLSSESFNSAHNNLFRNSAIDWHANVGLGQTQRSAVGYISNQGYDLYSRSILGDSDPAWYSHIWGFLDVGGSCQDDGNFRALTIRDSTGSPITTKSFNIPENLYFDVGDAELAQVSAAGITIGVTGGALRRDFNVALWGLTTIADGSSTPPPTQDPTTPPTTPPTTTQAPTTSAAISPVLTNKSMKLKVSFSERSSRLSAKEKKKLLRVVSNMGSKVTGGKVVGYVQLDGNTSNDRKLSTARARAVAKFLADNGIKVRLVTKGKGALNNKESSRRANITLRYAE